MSDSHPITHKYIIEKSEATEFLAEGKVLYKWNSIEELRNFLLWHKIKFTTFVAQMNEWINEGMYPQAGRIYYEYLHVCGLTFCMANWQKLQLPNKYLKNSFQLLRQPFYLILFCEQNSKTVSAWQPLGRKCSINLANSHLMARFRP